MPLVITPVLIAPFTPPTVKYETFLPVTFTRAIRAFCIFQFFSTPNVGSVAIRPKE